MDHNQLNYSHSLVSYSYNYYDAHHMQSVGEYIHKNLFTKTVSWYYAATVLAYTELLDNNCSFIVAGVFILVQVSILY